MPLMLGWSPGGFDLIKISEPWSFCQGAALEVREPSWLSSQCSSCSVSAINGPGFKLTKKKKARFKVWKTHQRSVQIALSSPGKSSLNKINTMRQSVERSHGKFNRANLLMETGWWHLQQNPLKLESEAGPGLSWDILVPLLLGQAQMHKFRRDFTKFLQTAHASGSGKTEKQQHSPEVTAALELGGNLQ